MFIALVLILFPRDFVVFCLLKNVLEISQSRRYFTIFCWLFPSATLSDSWSSYVLLLFCGFSDLSLRLIPISRRGCPVEEEEKEAKTKRQKVKETTREKKSERYNAGGSLCTHVPVISFPDNN